jgi:hypothetical protein
MTPSDMPMGVGDNQTRQLWDENRELRRRVAELEAAQPGACDAARTCGHPGYLALLREMAQLHARKAQDYGSDSDPLANIRSAAAIGIEPWRAAWLRACDKIHRINRWCLKGELACEGVEDSLMDLAAYALISLALLREKLCWRRPPLVPDLEAKTI